MAEKKTEPIARASSDLDKAFDLLVVIIALLYSIGSSYPELFAQSTPELSLETITMRRTVLPLISLTLLRLASIFIPNKNGQVLLKNVAWMTAFSIGAMIFFPFMEGMKFIKLSKSMTGILFALMMFISPLINYVLIFPRYKEKYPDISFFRGKVWLIVSYVLYFLILWTIIFLTSTNYAAW
jgi:hypothetical protein